MYRWATSAVGGGEGGDHAQSARARKGRGNREGKQHVVLLNTENAGRGDARGWNRVSRFRVSFYTWCVGPGGVGG
jgi:hypothetical protein